MPSLRMKICVYAISKNEEKFVKRFCESTKDADYILIADTGSTDNTVSIAKECGAIVYNIAVRPWRYDTARNISLGLVPKDVDICITLDLDEIMLPGWRNAIEQVWIKNETFPSAKRFPKGCVLQHGKMEKDKIVYEYTNIFSRTGWIWEGICHERLLKDLKINETDALFSNKILVQHLPDNTKNRVFYYDLLKANVDEYPTELVPLYNYAKELYKYKKYNETIEISNKFINLYKKTCISSEYELNYIYILKGSCYIYLNNFSKCEKNYLLACDMNMKLRQPLILLARLYFNREKFKESYIYYTKALLIQTPIYRREEMNPDYWGYSPWNFASEAATKLGKYDKGKEYKAKALEILKII